MEGDKGGGSFGHWHTARKSVNQRWKEYEAARRAKFLPIIGPLALFTKVWKKHEEVSQFSAKAHSKCDRCG
eukprot:6130450-Pleurochrysis_carterae.AAC.1